METTQGDLSVVQERCLMLQRRNEALTRELQAVKASGWSAVRDAEDKTCLVSEMKSQQQELEQQISFLHQRLAERCAAAVVISVVRISFDVHECPMCTEDVSCCIQGNAKRPASAGTGTAAE